MAQLYNDFEQYTANAAPGDWTRTWDTGGDFDIRDESGTKRLRVAEASSNRRISYWDDVGADANSEIYATFEFSSSSSNIMPVLRANNAAQSSRTGYLFRIFSDGTLRIIRAVSGSESAIGSDVSIGSLSTDTLYRLRFRVSGTGATVTISGKCWAASGSEPGSWDITRDDTASNRITSAGFAALGWVGTSSIIRWHDCGFGTNGDAAPTGPVGGGVEVEVTAEGGFSLGGSAPYARERAYSGIGGFEFGGTAPVSFSTELVVEGDGGYEFDVQAEVARSVARSGAGGMELGGIAPVSRTKVVVGDGGLSFGGTADVRFPGEDTGGPGLLLKARSLVRGLVRQLVRVTDSLFEAIDPPLRFIANRGYRC